MENIWCSVLRSEGLAKTRQESWRNETSVCLTVSPPGFMVVRYDFMFTIFPLYSELHMDVFVKRADVVG